MELTHDWRALNEVLFKSQSLQDGGRSIVLLENGETVVDGVVSDGKAFHDFNTPAVSMNKHELDALAEKYGADQALVLTKTLFDQAVSEASTLGANYYQQLQMIRSRLSSELKKNRASSVVSRRHFVLDLFGKYLRRLLPRQFNVLLFVDNRNSLAAGAPNAGFRAILLTYRNGQLDQFFEPDFSSLHENRMANWQNDSADIGQYLESRYLLPCYAIFMHQDQWDRCLMLSRDQGNPWFQFVKHVDAGTAAVYPRKKFLVQALLAALRIIVYFGRL